jgi:hypothetical protein
MHRAEDAEAELEERDAQAPLEGPAGAAVARLLVQAQLMLHAQKFYVLLRIHKKTYDKCPTTRAFQSATLRARI